MARRPGKPLSEQSDLIGIGTIFVKYGSGDPHSDASGEGKLSMKKIGRLLTVLLLAGSASAATADSLANRDYVPQLGDLMNAAQVRHIKLVLAGKAQNWELAAYELERLSQSLADAAVLYSGIPVDDITTMTKPLAAVNDAIGAKDGKRFIAAASELTEKCNSCHQTMNRAFILMRLPTDQPFGNQIFQRQNPAKR
jgi:hypothetical protein